MTYRVCYADTDRMGRVYYANYLVFAERARTELIRAAGRPYRELEQDGTFLPVRSCAARYFGYAEYDDELRFHTWATRLRHATLTFVTGIWRAPEAPPLVLVTVELACVSAEGRPQPFPADSLEAITAFLAPEAVP